MDSGDILEEVLEAGHAAQFLLDGWFGILICISITAGITIALSRLFEVVWGWFGKDTIHHRFIKNVLKAFIWGVGLFIALSWLPNFPTAVRAILAGSGILAVVIGLAAQESLSNFFNGLFISMFKPFEVGDRVLLVSANITGIVEDLTIRHTVIRTFTNSRIIVPNSVISREMVENSHYGDPQASQFIDVIVGYEVDIDKVKEIMASIIGNHPEFVDTRTAEQKLTNPKVPIFIRALGLYGIEVRASMWTATVAENFRACSDVRLQIVKEFKENGIRIAEYKFPVI